MIRRLFRRKGAAKLPDHVTVGRHSYGLSRRNLVRPSAAAPRSALRPLIGPAMGSSNKTRPPPHARTDRPSASMSVRSQSRVWNTTSDMRS